MRGLKLSQKCSSDILPTPMTATRCENTAQPSPMCQHTAGAGRAGSLQEEGWRRVQECQGGGRVGRQEDAGRISERAAPWKIVWTQKTSSWMMSFYSLFSFSHKSCGCTHMNTCEKRSE